MEGWLFFYFAFKARYDSFNKPQQLPISIIAIARLSIVSIKYHPVKYITIPDITTPTLTSVSASICR